MNYKINFFFNFNFYFLIKIKKMILQSPLCCAIIQSGNSKGNRCYRKSIKTIEGKNYCGLHSKKIFSNKNKNKNKKFK